MTATLEEAPSHTTPGRRPRRQGLHVAVRTDDDGVVHVRVSGKLDIYTASRLRQRMARLDLAAAPVVLDVTRVTLIDSSGLGTLLSLANRARQAGKLLGLVCLRDLAEVLAITRLEQAFDVTLAPEPAA